MHLTEEHKEKLTKAASWSLRTAGQGLRAAGKGIHWVSDKLADAAVDQSWKLKKKLEDKQNGN